MRMEMPPGWRGYGADDHIPHPQAAARQAEAATSEPEPVRPAA